MGCLSSKIQAIQFSERLAVYPPRFRQYSSPKDGLFILHDSGNTVLRKMGCLSPKILAIQFSERLAVYPPRFRQYNSPKNGLFILHDSGNTVLRKMDCLSPNFQAIQFSESPLASTRRIFRQSWICINSAVEISHLAKILMFTLISAEKLFLCRNCCWVGVFWQAETDTNYSQLNLMFIGPCIILIVE